MIPKVAEAIIRSGTEVDRSWLGPPPLVETEELTRATTAVGAGFDWVIHWNHSGGGKSDGNDMCSPWGKQQQE
jgi:hypothetical protein